MKISLKKYLIYSSIFAIFTEAFNFHFIIDWKLLYLIIGVNFIFLSRLKKITINKYFVLLMLFVFFHGLITFSIIRIPIRFMLSQIIGISVVSTYYYNFVSFFRKDDLVNIYTKLTFYVALIGYPLWFFNINSNDGHRFQSIFTEPAHYAIVVIPAAYYFLKSKQYTFFIVTFGSLLLSQSSIGYMGCGLIFILPLLNLKRIGYFIITLPLLFSVFYATYTINPLIKLRVDDTIESMKSLNTGKFKPQINVSSYALMSNLFIAKCNFLDHPLGSGLGSHYYMHTAVYYNHMRPPEYIITLKEDKINAPEAASLFIRLFSDFGLIGLITILFFLFIIFHVFKNKKLILEQGIVIYILLKLLRDGHYFPPEFYFFLWILMLSLFRKLNPNDEKFDQLK